MSWWPTAFPNRGRIGEMRQPLHDALVNKANLLADEDVVVPRRQITNLALQGK